MALVGRKKNIGLHIDHPVARNLGKVASPSLYQQCSALRNRLMDIHGFAYYFSLLLTNTSNSRQSTDPVNELWDLFSFGIPLCYLFDQLPAGEGFPKINNSEFKEDEYSINPENARKRAIILFAMAIKSNKVTQAIPSCEQLTVTDIWDRNSSDGLVKFVNTVTAIVDYLPSDVFESYYNHSPFQNQHGATSLEPLITAPANAQGPARNNVIREMIETERKYVQGLESMKKYSDTLLQGNTIDKDTIRLLFPNLNNLLDFQRKFLVQLEVIAELPWEIQRWGELFLKSEEKFSVYQPYCTNYNSALELLSAHEQNLTPLNDLINARSELPAFLLKPIQRVCEYPLLLDSLIEACSTSNYPFYEELKRGSAAAKRIANKVNDAQRGAENELIIKSLYSRVDDWKGYHLENFGELLLSSIFVITKSDIDREYHVFLFEKIILCCKEVPQKPTHRKSRKEKNDITLKSPTQVTKAKPPLLLMGRVFLGNVTQASPVTRDHRAQHYPLSVVWKQDGDLKNFTLHCKWEDQMRQWEAQINRLARGFPQDGPAGRNDTAFTGTKNDTWPSKNHVVKRNISYPLLIAPEPIYTTFTTTVTPKRSVIGGANTVYDSTERNANSQTIYEDELQGSEEGAASSSKKTPINGNYRGDEDTNLPPGRVTVSDNSHTYEDDTNAIVIPDRHSPPSDLSPNSARRRDQLIIRRHHQELNMLNRNGDSRLDMPAVVGQLNDIFKNVEQYKRLLRCPESDIQQLLDAFQVILDMPEIDSEFRRQLVVATQRLSKRAGMYPTCYELSDVELIGDHPVANGGFADIYRGRFLGQNVCLKVIRLYQTSHVDMFLKQFSAEAILWDQLIHQNLLPIYGLYRYNARICLVSPWMEHGDVNAFLKYHPDANRLLLVSDIVSGLTYLHDHDIVHGDLKGVNILVNGSHRACLADFGLSAVTDTEILHWTSHSSAASKGGSTRWQAPELFDVENDRVVHNSKSSDIYALACAMYEIFTGRLPFFELTRDSVIILKVREGVRPSRPPASDNSWGSWGLTEALWSLLETCWTEYPSIRPTARGMMESLALNNTLDDERIGTEEIFSPPRFRKSQGGRPDVSSVDDLSILLRNVRRIVQWF